MSKDRKGAQAAPVRTRINYKAVAILGGVLVLGLLSIIPIRMLQDRSLRSSAMDQTAKAIKDGDKAQALRLLEDYVQNWPMDTKALDMQGRLLAETAYSSATLLAAAEANDRLLRMDPDGTYAPEARRRVIECYIRQSNLVLSDAGRLPGQEKKPGVKLDSQALRFGAAEALARPLVKDSPQSAEAHRLLGMALDGQSRAGDSAKQKEAIKEYESTLKIDPADVVAARQLAMIYVEDEQKPDAAAAERILDELLKLSPKNFEVRLARRELDEVLKKQAQARNNLDEAVKRQAMARAEIEAAVALAPDNVNVRCEAAGEALRASDIAGARAHLAAIPKELADNKAVRLLQGQIDLSEYQPDQAIEQWRLGLASVGGSDIDLTYRLAQILIKLGQLGEANLMIEQFQRLQRDKNTPVTSMLQAAYEEAAGRFAKAIDLLESARDKLPSRSMEAELNLILGRCYLAAGDESRALTALRRATNLEPRLLEPRRVIASMLRPRDPEGAINELRQGLAQNGDDIAIMVELVRQSVILQLARPRPERDWNAAEAIQANAEKLEPGSPEVLLGRVELLAAQGKYDDAVKRLTEATGGRFKSRPDVWYTLATILDRLNKPGEAIQVLERGSAPDAAGDRAELRSLRARLLAKTGHAQAAKDLLAKLDSVPRRDRAALAKAQTELLRELGDMDGARRAAVEWSKLSPDDPQPGLTLVEMGLAGDAEATKLGLAALRSIGGENEPYELAASALSLLSDPKPGQAIPPAVLKQADEKIKSLGLIAPQLPLGFLLRGMFLERSQQPAEAIEAYKKAMRSNTRSAAIGSLVRLYTQAKRYDDLDALRKDVGGTMVDQLSAAESLKQGDKNRAEQLASQLVEAQPDSLEFRAAQAKLLTELGRPLEAQETLRELTVRQPKDPSAWLALFMFQLAQKDMPGAQATIRRITAEYKGNRPDLLIARCRWMIGERDAAGKMYEESLSKNPEDMETLKSASEFYEAVGNRDRAEALIRRVLKLDPTASWAARWLALRVAEKGGAEKWAEAWSMVAPGGSASGDTPEDRLARASLLDMSPDPARRREAIPLLMTLAEDLLPSAPAAIEARSRVAQGALETNRPEEAARVILPSADQTINPNPAALAIAVEALSRLKRPNDAQARLNRLAELEPKSSRTVNARSWVARASDKPAEAASLIEAHLPEIEKTPGGEVVSLAFLTILNTLNQPDASERAARLVAERWPRSGWALGRVLLARGKVNEGLDAIEAAAKASITQEAVETALALLDSHSKDAAIVNRVGALVERAFAEQPKKIEYVIALASVRHLQGRVDDELAQYRKAIEISPGNASFFNNMAWTLSEAKGQHAEALKSVDEAIRRFGRVPNFLDTRGMILTRLNRLDEAIKDLEESAKLKPDDTTYFHLALAYAKAGRDADRRAARDKAKAAGFDPSSVEPSEKADVDIAMAP